MQTLCVQILVLLEFFCVYFDIICTSGLSSGGIKPYQLYTNTMGEVKFH